jgi:lipopolysaccharide export LptBFGC system permease protein LptF
MHLYNARYSQRDDVDPYDLSRMRDGINVAEGTLPISLVDLYEKEKRRASRSMLSLEQLLEQLKAEDPKMRSSSRTEINKRFSFPMACLVFALVGVPLVITAHRRETSFGFAASLVIGVFYFLFIIVADTCAPIPSSIPSFSSGYRTSFSRAGLWLFRRLTAIERRRAQGVTASIPCAVASASKRASANPDTCGRARAGQPVFRPRHAH